MSKADQNGIEVTIRKYQLARSLYYKWKSSFDHKGSDGLVPQYRKVDPHVRELEKENERLRRIIAKQALYIEIKDELLKKKSESPNVKRELCRKYADRLSQKELCSVFLLPKSTRYYNRSNNKPGAKASEFTYCKNGEKEWRGSGCIDKRCFKRGI